MSSSGIVILPPYPQIVDSSIRYPAWPPTQLVLPDGKMVFMISLLTPFAAIMLRFHSPLSVTSRRNGANTMTTSLNISWTPPPTETLLFGAQCALLAVYIDQLAQSAFARPFEGPYAVVTDYLRSILPSGFKPAPSTWQLLEWHEALRPVARNEQIDKIETDFIARALAVAETAGCYPAICALLEASSQLDADLAGVGVLVSYGIEAFLVTLYAVVLVLPKLWWLSTGRTVPRRLFHLSEAFQASTHELFVGAIILNLGIQLALLQKAAGAIPDGEADRSSYYRGLFRLVSAFSFLPVMLLFPVVSSGWRRVWAKRAIIGLLWALFVACNLIDPDGIMRGVRRPSVSIGDSLHDTNNEETRMLMRNVCDFRMDGGRGVWNGIGSCMWVVMAAPICWALLSLALWVWTLARGPRARRHRYPRLKGHPVLGPVRTVIVALLSLASMIGMWLVLGSLLYIRFSVARISPEAHTMNYWTFGQILAVATWTPVFMELGFILICKSLVPRVFDAQQMIV